MKLSGVENKEKSMAQLIVEVSAEEFDKAIDGVYRKNRKSIMVPGFRKGKAPRKIIETMYGKSVFDEDAVSALYTEAFQHGVSESGLRAVGKPSVENMDISDDRVLTFTFGTAVYPEVTLGEYKELSALRELSPVTDEDIDGELESLRKRNARIVPAQRPAKDGDTVLLDFTGYLDGKPFEGGEAKEHSLVLGSGSFIPGFEEQLVGAGAGDEKEVNVTFPEDYTGDLAGKDAVFKVKVHEIKESLLPDLDDDFAKDVSEFDTLAEYRDSIKEKMTQEREKTAEDSFRNALMEKAAENMTAEVPDAMVEDQMDQMVQEFYYNISAQGMNPEEYLGMVGMTPVAFRDSCRPSGLKRVLADILLEAVAAAEKIEVTDEEIDTEYKRLSEQYGMEDEKIKASIPSENVVKDLKMKKSADIIYSTAKAEESDGAAEQSAAKKKAAPKKSAATEKSEKKPAAKKGAADEKTAGKIQGEKPVKKPASRKKPEAGDASE